MNSSQAKTEKRSASARMYDAWHCKAMIRAQDKIRKYTALGKDQCEIDLKFPTKKPDDHISLKVAERLCKDLQVNQGFTTRIISRIHHIGAIVRIEFKD